MFAFARSRGDRTGQACFVGEKGVNRRSAITSDTDTLPSTAGSENGSGGCQKCD